MLIRKRYSTVDPRAVTGYAVGVPEHSAKDGGTIWYSGGKLAADLTLPKLRARWSASGPEDTATWGRDLPPAAFRGVLRATVIRAAEQAPGEAGFFARLCSDGVLARLRFSELHPGDVTGYSVALPGHVGRDGEPVWYAGGKLAAELSLPRLRRRWSPGRPRRSVSADHDGVFRVTAAERNAIFEHAARYAAVATEHIRWCALHNPARAADAAHAVADALHIAAALTRSRALRGAADCYDRAARVPYGRVPEQTQEGRQLRAAARLLALTGPGSGDGVQRRAGLIAKLAALVVAVAELRQAQRQAAQAAAARHAAMRLRAQPGQVGSAAWYARSQALLAAGAQSAAQPVAPGASRSRPPPAPVRAKRPAGR